jgi:RNA polymerase sigma-70 factor, ECF subfamily
MSALEGDQRMAFVLTQLMGFRYAEAAQIMDCPVGTIRSRVARARSQLIARLDSDQRSALVEELA